MKCKITKAEIKPFMTFGKMPIANAFVKKDDFDKAQIDIKNLEYFK